jgi:hypothetical protein
MKTIRTLAAGLLLLTGALHLISVVLAKFEATSIITIVFGVAYLAIGSFLFREGRMILWFGAIVPVVGLLLAVAGMFISPTLLGGIFIAIDVVIIFCCFILLFRKG